MIHICSVLLLLFSSASIAGQMYKLPSGEKIEIIGIEYGYVKGADEWVYTLKYLTNDLSDMEVLCQRANYLWPVVKQQVESKGWSWASVKAQKITEQSDLLLGSGTKTEYAGYAIGFKKDEYGNWVDVGEKCSQN
ncbi:hypothetical protein [Vibrio pelagius]|uniref:hypothetical protein n=1 Tax=Vibrio pelagius TaxID=28169 RepID=UPI0021C30944|nr:hypothetical protein [Vibrio pelagius]